MSPEGVEEKEPPAGHYLDQKLATFPWLTLLGLLFGVAAGFINLLKAVKAFDPHD